MLSTGNYGLRKPELGEPVDVRDFNYNADIIDRELKNRPEKAGNASDMTVDFEEARQLTELESGDSLRGLFGKLKLAVKNLLALIKLIGTTDISAIGGGTITDTISALNTKISMHAHDDRYYTEEEIINLLVKKAEKNHTHDWGRALADFISIYEDTSDDAWIPGDGTTVTISKFENLPAGLYIFLGQLLIPIDTEDGGVKISCVYGEPEFSATHVYHENGFKKGTYTTVNMTYFARIDNGADYYFIARQTSGIDTKKGKYYFQAIRLTA